MPNNIMFSNKEALRKAVERVEWKLKMARSFHFEDPIYGKYAGGQYGFDARDLMNFYTFFLDLKDFDNMSEEERINQFNSEARKIAHAFYETHGEKEGMPDYKSVEPYIRRMYDEVDADLNIDWDDVDAIEHLLSSWNLQQTLGMMAEKFAVEFTKNFTLEEKQRIDSKMQSTFASQRILQSKLIHENREYSKRLSKGSFDEGTIEFMIEAGISASVAKATKNGYDPIVLDPEYSEAFKNYFVYDEFEMEQTGELSSDDNFNQNGAAESFAEFLPKISAKNAFEHVAVQSTTNDYIYPDEEFVLVDGKSVNDYIKEQTNQGMTTAKAKIEAGKWIRRAMLDGNSVVTLMRPIINGDGSVVFQHQQIKTDLDKVNAIDRAENYSWFRRALDTLRIYRIPKKCVSNKARDAVQAQKLAGAELQNALKAVEDKFIERYNLRASQEIPYRIQSAFPKISRIENVLENQLSSDAPVNSVETGPMRMSLNLSSQDLENPVSNVPEEPKEINSEEVKIEENKIEEPQVQVQNETVSEESAQENNVEENNVEENNVEENKVEEPDEISYKDKHEKASIDQNLEKDIKAQIVDIMKTNADVGEHRLPEKADGIFENTLRNAHDHCQAMDDESGDAERDDLMRDFAKNLFENTYMYVRDAHVYYDDNIAHRVIAAQKITNLILSTYTPVGFDADKYGKYADNYALNNKEMLRDALTNLYEDCAETDEAFDNFMEELNAARLESSPAMDEEEAQQTEEEVEQENEEPEQETKTEEPVVEEPVAEETKTEPQVQSEEEAAKKQAEAEEAQKKLEEIKNNVQQITVTEDNFKELFEVAKNDTALEAKVRVELEAVLNEVYTGAYVHDNATSILYTASTIPNLFPDGQFTTEDSNIGGMVFEIFDDAYNKLDSTKLDIDQKIIYAQKIADIVVRNYPPVCHDIDGFSKFADNYIINGTTLYSQDKLRAFLAEKEIPEEEIEAHVSSINGAVAKPDDVKEERYELEELDNPFEHGPNYIHQNKAEAPKINRFKPRRLFGQGEGELYSAGRHQARKDELERLRSYDQEAMAQTEAIAEDALEYLEDIEEETAIETNENEIVAEKPAEEVTESIDDIANNLVASALSDAMAELEEEQRKAEEEAKEEAARRKAESDARKTNIVLRNMCVRRIRDTKIAVETREQLYVIFRNPSYEDKQLMTCLNMANEIPKHMADQFEKARYDLLTPQGVERMTKSVFSEALYCTEESGANLETRIGMAQRITDLMMKDYSVAAFVPTEFGAYADNYIVLNKGILKELIKDQTSDLSENEVSDLMKRVDREMARELSGWNARDVERRLDTLALPYEEIYEKIMGDKAPELKKVSEEEFRSFKAQYEENLKNDKLTENVKAQISEIYSEAGLKDSKLEEATNAAFDDFVDIMTQTYNDLQKVTDHLKTAKKMMTYTAEASLHYVCSSAYNYINDMSERLVISQRITDVLLNNYSPAAFVNGDLDKFADNYITISNDRLDSWMQDYHYGNNSEQRANIINGIEKLMNRAKDEFVEEEISNEPEEIDEDDIDDMEDEIEVEEKPKEIERESIPGLKDDVEGKVNADKSTRVIDENNKKAPSLNNN